MTLRGRITRASKYPAVRAWLFGVTQQPDEDAYDARAFAEPAASGPTYADLSRCGSYDELQQRFGTYAALAGLDIEEAAGG